MLDPDNLQLKNSVLVIKTELQTILYEENAFALFQLCRIFFESGDKAGKMLALRLKQQEKLSSSINDEDGSLVCNQIQINHAFTKFYSTLYKSECCTSEKEMEHFFRDIHLPTLCQEERES